MARRATKNPATFTEAEHLVARYRYVRAWVRGQLAAIDLARAGLPLFSRAKWGADLDRALALESAIFAQLPREVLGTC
jgi:hypothetical protein